jgi:hypothetical protein
MSVVLFRVLLAGVMTGFLMQTTAAVAQEVYLCKPRDTRETGNWIAPEVAIAYKPVEKTALVDDAIIQTFETGPKPAKVDTDNTKRMTFSWKVKTRAGTSKDGTQTINMVYRLTIQKADLSASFIVVPQGYSNTFQTQGKCQRIKG